MRSTFFISDVHLGADSPRIEKQKERKLLSFLDHVSQTGDRLFIVGDLFDFWFEYRTVIPRGYTRILCSLSHLRELDVEMHYIAGNHDFWMRNFLEDELNIHIHFDEYDCTISGKRFHIFHGDGIARHDKGYRFMKKIFRSRTNIFLYSLVHPDLGIPFAKWISSLSRKHTGSGNPPDDSDYVAAATQKFKEGFDYVIYGHLHFPRHEVFAQKEYINLGDWITNYSYAEYRDKELELKRWK
ncbi:MAG: UDP-2,3-diacylglucosamine diphosphatase [Calditrichia bacterium]